MARQLKDSLDVIRSVTMPDTASLHRQFADRRNKLNAHVRRMHERRAPAGLSIYAVLGKLERLPDTARNDARWAGAELVVLDAPKVEQATSLLRELASGFAGLVTGDDPRGPGGSDDRGYRTERNGPGRSIGPAMAGGCFGAAGCRIHQHCASVHHPDGRPEDVGCSGGNRRRTHRYDPSVFGLDVDQLASHLSAGRNVVRRAWAMCTSRDFRASRAALLAARTAGKASVLTLIQELDELRAICRRWQDIAQPHTSPRSIPEALRLRHALGEVLEDLKGLSRVFQRDQ